jgi:Mg/Co/Ni transporter MgtE
MREPRDNNAHAAGTEDDNDSPAVGLLRLNVLPERLVEEPPHVSYGDESVCNAFRSRVGWLGLFLVGLWSAAFIIDAFEHTLQANVELAHFVPLIIGQGGNAGSQAVSSVIRGLAGKEIDVHSKPTGWVVAKESAVGALCGLVLGTFVLVVGYVCHPNPNPNPNPSPNLSPNPNPNPNQVGYVCRIVSFNVGVVVCISLPLVSLWANLLGAALPLLAARLRRNPAVTSAPLMTTIIDSTGL